MKDVLLYIWQLPQNLLALILRVIYAWYFGKPFMAEYYDIKYWWFPKWRCGVSLGNYVLLGTNYLNSMDTIAHEYGHTRQSRMLGPMYLLVIGLPSAMGNLWDRWFHRKWSYKDCCKWYYNQPWEKWADKLGGVERHYD